MNKVKRDQRFTVVIGNPPYAGHSSNKGEWISSLVDAYYVVDGKPLGEKNPKWLQDDYVKFIRFGQYCIQKAAVGVHSFITNHGYIDNPTFRGMRQSLMNSFDLVRVFDLHGNSTKKERAPDGSDDDNVFDIKQGVAIFSAHRSRRSDGRGMVEHGEVFGSRHAKYRSLTETTFRTSALRPAFPASPFHLFVPQNLDLRTEYEAGISVTELMPVNVLGFQTHRDEIAVAIDEKDLKKNVTSFLGKSPTPKDWERYCSKCEYGGRQSETQFGGRVL